MASSQAFSANPAAYTVLSTIGTGTCTEVYKVKDAFGSVYALKKVDLAKLEGDAESSDEFCEQAVDELKTLTYLASDHEKFVRIYDHFLDGTMLHISMELCEEGSLKDALDRKRKKGEWFDEPLLINWLVQLASMFKSCHTKNILYRDIRPENIFLTAGGRTIKLGIGKVLHTSSTSRSNTAPNMPAELLKECPYSEKSEVWALGCLMYELMAQKVPIMVPMEDTSMEDSDSLNPVEHLPSTRYSNNLREFTEAKMLFQNEKDRPTMAEILTEPFVLEAMAHSEEESRKPESPKPKRPKDVDVSNILRASETGNLEVLRRHLDKTSMAKLLDESTWRKSAVNRNGETPLHRAARVNQVSVLELLWPIMGEKLGLAQDIFYATPIHRAALNNAIGFVEFILAKDSSYVETRDGKYGRTVLHQAAEKGHVELCEKLVSVYGANMFAKSNSAADQEQMPIHLAAEFGRLLVVKYFVSENTKLERQPNGDGDLPIHKAALKGETEVVEYFLDRGQSVETPGFRGRTILHSAAEKGHVQLCETLVVQYIADVFARSSTEDGEDMPIHLAAVLGQLPVVELFVSFDPELELQKSADGNMPIHKAALMGHTEIVEFFLNGRHQSIEFRGQFGRTVLHQAAEHGHVELCVKLVSLYGADMFVRSNVDDFEHMPIHLAAAFGHLPVIRYFVSLRPELDRQTYLSGSLPIHKAALSGQTAVVEFFLNERHQSVETRGRWGRTILHCAADKGQVELCDKLVTDYYADTFARSNSDDGEELPIHTAAYFGRLAVVKFFANQNRNLLLARNGLNETPLQVAEIGVHDGQAGADEVVAYLKSESEQD